MLRLICGPSGSGKTTELIGRIQSDIQNQTRCFLLVPEQQAYISERDIPSVLPKNAGLFFEVVHFSGLAEDVFREYGGVVNPGVTGGMKKLLMWDALRTAAPLLQQYGKSAVKDVSFSSLMLDTVEELRINGIQTEQLEHAAQELPADAALSKKLSDLALIDAIYREKIDSLFGSDPSDRLLRMAELLRQHRYFENCHIYVDSFTSFTMQEYTVLREILKQAHEVTVTLCSDSFHSTLPHFESVIQTAKRLTKLASEADVAVEKETRACHPASKPTELAILERDIWRFDRIGEFNREIARNEPEAVRFITCPNLYEEVEAAALYIMECVQSGIAYGEIAVVVRDTEIYRGVLDAALERHKIPFFLSEAVSLSSRPLSRLILSALRAVSRNYQAQDVMTLVKTGLTGVSASDAAMFEEYCETWYISGKRFADESWSMNPDGLKIERSMRADLILEAANRVRRALMDPLQRFAAELRSSERLYDRCNALYRYLCALQIPEQLSERAKKELAEGHRREAEDLVRLYRFITEALTDLCRILPDATLTVDEFISALTILFSESSFASVPNLHDCVMIGSASTLRVENVKASLLLGLCEGEFPRALNDNGLLTESDKDALEAFDIYFDSRSGTRSAEELLYVYRAMAKPSERLYLSTVQAQVDGSMRTPSLAFSRASYLLGKAPTPFDLSEIRRALGESSVSEFERPMTLPATTDPITLYLSQSKIKTFLLCPFSYYSAYELKLREKKDSRPNYADDGLFLHYVFEKFLICALGEDGKLYPPKDEEMEPLAAEIVDRYLKKTCPIPPEQMDNRLLHLFARLKTMALIMLKDILNELKMSRFVPYRFEQKIGGDGPDSLPAVVLELNNGSKVCLRGTIDRVDLYKENGTCYFRVVDYKSGTHKFSLEDVRSGLDIQLILYLFALLSADDRAVPGGAAYLYAASEKGAVSIRRSGIILKSEELLNAADQTPERTYTQPLIPKTRDEILDLMNEMHAAVCGAAERILRGEAQKTPSEQACRFCSIRTNCDKVYHK